MERDMFGPWADDLLAYQTLKVVRLKDHRLGLLYYGLMLCIAVFVFGFQILYGNNHFDKRDVSGTARLSVRHPTLQGCNPKDRGCKSDFTALTNLPYCTEYRGKSKKVPEELRRDCTFADRFTLLPDGVPPGAMLLPTRITTIMQKRSCSPGPANNFTCSNEFEDTGEEDEKYVADIERYSILISHSYRRDTMSGNNDEILGYYQECDTSSVKQREAELQATVFGASECMGTTYRVPIECISDECHFLAEGLANDAASVGAGAVPNASAHQHRHKRAPLLQGSAALVAGGSGASPASEDGAGPRKGRLKKKFAEDGVYAVPEGDVFTVAKLLQLAGVRSLDNSTTIDSETLRRAGTIVNIEVRYSNLVPFRSTFGGGEVTYDYHITLKPMHNVRDDVVRWAPPDSSTRFVERRDGIMFVVTVTGHLGFFSIVNTLLMLAEAASMLAVATLLTDKIAIYLMERADVYYGSKYEVPAIDMA